MTLSKYNIRIIILLYVSAMFNLRYYLTVLLNPESWREVMQHSSENPRLITLLAIYVPVVAFTMLGIFIIRYLSEYFWKASRRPVRLLFIVWATATLFFPLAVNKVYFTLLFSVGYSIAYLILSWVMILLEKRSKEIQK